MNNGLPSQNIISSTPDFEPVNPETQNLPPVNMQEIGIKAKDAFLGKKATEIVENGISELKQDPAIGYDAIQEARERYSRGEE